MLTRNYHDKLSKKLSYFPAVAILGPRQVGKTTLARQIAERTDRESIYLDLETKADVEKLSNDLEAYLAQYKDKLVIIDEVQQMPEIFVRLRPLIDKHRIPGRFLLLGSASPSLVNGVSESLAGRISYLDLPPFTISEISATYNVNFHWFRGGFPNAFFAPNDEIFHDWAASFIRSYVERDFNHLFGQSLNSSLINRLWQMIAYKQGDVWNAEELSRALGVTAPVTNKYLDLLEGAFLIRRLKPWFVNNGKRLAKSPKVYIRDTGILHHLNRIDTLELLSGHPIVGASWEGYVVEQIALAMNTNIDIFYYRTHVGAELDVVLTKGSKPVAGIEIKYSNAPSISKGFYHSIEDVETEQNFVITPNSDTYPIKKGTVCSLAVFITKYLPEIN